MTRTAGEKRNSTRELISPALIELAMIVVISVIALVLFTSLDASEATHGWIHDFEHIEADDVFLTITLSSLLMAWYAYRRWNEFARELARRVEAEQAQKHSEMDRMLGESIIELAGVAVISIDEDQNITSFNQSAKDVFGYTKEEALGSPLDTLMPEGARKGHGQLVRQFGASDGISRWMGQRREIFGRRKDGELFPVEASISKQESSKGPRYTVILHDISERIQAAIALSRANRVLESLISCNEIVQGAHDEEKLISDICRAVVETAGYKLAWVGYAENNPEKSIRPIATHGEDNGYVAAIHATYADTERGQGPIGTVIRTAKPIVVQDYMIGATFAPWREAALKRGFAACSGMPLLDGDRAFGALMIYAAEPNAFDKDELELLVRLADTVAFGILSLREASQRKGAEEMLRKLSSAVEQSPYMVFITDTDGRIQYINQRFTQMSGYREDEVIGKTADVLRSEQTPASIYEDFWTSIKSGGEWRGEICDRRKDGSEYWVRASISPVHTENGEITHFVAMHEDITDRKKSEEETAALERELMNASKLEAVGQLASGIAHEINTPTQYISDNLRFMSDAYGDMSSVITDYLKLGQTSPQDQGFSDKLQEVAQKAEEADIDYLLKEIPQALTQALEGTEQVARIVLAMKEFSHPTSKESGDADINKMIENTIMVSRNEWKYVAELVADLDPELPLVRCQAGELNQVLLNLIVNAAHAIEETFAKQKNQKDQGRITVTTRQDGKWAEIRVSDTGSGIPQDIRDQIFNPFFTTKEVGKGTGQGLSISHDIIVKKHHGAITFETEEDKGTTFIIRIPVAGTVPEEEESA